jgi:hypothetical protein
MMQRPNLCTSQYTSWTYSWPSCGRQEQHRFRNNGAGLRGILKQLLNVYYRFQAESRVRFLFIANSRHRLRPYQDPAVRYRCYNPAEDLCRLGHLDDVCLFHEMRSSVIRNYEVFVFHRPVYSRRLKKSSKVLPGTASS